MARNYTNIVPNATSVTSGFSPARPHPTLGETRPHNGVDVAAPAGSPIYAPSDGIVDKVGINPNSSAGYWLSIKHTLPDGTVVFTRYLHLQEKPSLNEKEPISEGQEIGKVGNTGKTPEGRPIGTGPHLHYEERMLPPDSKSKTPSWSDATPLNPEWDRFRFSGGIPYDYYRRPEFNREFRKPFSDAKGWQPPRDPIILDLDGDGLETVGLASNVYFDHDGDGVLTKTVWAGKDDALLVWDRNGNALIDTGAELFGDFTPLPNGTLAPNGFAALAALDANGDGVIDASDPAFAELKLWRDTSQDGQTGAGELISLADAGIVSLNLAHTLKNQRLSNGNTLSREGSFTRADGSTSAMGEFRLAIDTFHTKFAEAIEVPEALKGLPTMGGAGNVRELREAAAQSGTVAGVLAQFQAAPTRAEQKALLDQLLTDWADTSGMAGSLEERAAGQYRIQYEAFGNERRSSHIDTVAFAAVSSGSVGGGAALMTDAGAPYLSERYRNLIAEWRRKLHVLEALCGRVAAQQPGTHRPTPCGCNGQYFFNLPEKKSQTDGPNWGLAVSAGSSGGDACGGALRRESRYWGNGGGGNDAVWRVAA